MMQVIQVITKWHFCKITNSKTMSWLSSLKETLPHYFALDIMYMKYSTRPNLCHATNYTVQVEQNVICHTATTLRASLEKSLCYASPQVCMLPNTVQNCSMQSAQACIITAPKLHKNGKGKLCEESIKTVGKNNSKITYFVPPLNLSQGSTKGTVS